MASAIRRHALFAPAPGWGQNRPLVSLAAKLVHERSDIIITFIMAGDYQSKLEHEVDRYFNEGEKALKENIRILHLGGVGNTDRSQVYQAYLEGFAQTYPMIYGEEPVPCAMGRIYPPVARPDVILLDVFLYGMLQTIRKVSKNSVPVLGWYSPSPLTMVRFCAPPSLGGLGNVPLKAAAIAEETGKPVNEVLNDLYQPDGEVSRLPGMPEMYDYEFLPHHFNTQMVATQNVVVSLGFKFGKECDGSVSVGNASFEPEACAAYRMYYAPRPVYFMGPLLPDEIPTGNQGDPLFNSQKKGLTDSFSNDDAEVKAFLDTMFKTHGDNCLLYMSFGSQHWPSGNGVWKVVEVILDLKIPLILSYDPKRAEMPSHIQEQLRASEIAIVSAWAPQYIILGHKATGWFLTHCGNNSITEAVSHGVPMIAYPLCADQPLNAAYISSTLDIAYELFETRVGMGLKPLRRGVQPEGTSEAIEKEIRSVFSKAWGHDGAQKRENVRALARKINVAWDEGGEARNELGRFLQNFFPKD